MWKTEHESWPSASERCQLCPNCDSLGPHRAVPDDLAWQAWLECIDCGAQLGRLTRQGLEPSADESVSDSTPHGRLEPLHNGILSEVLERTRARTYQPKSTLEALLLAGRVGLLPPEES